MLIVRKCIQIELLGLLLLINCVQISAQDAAPQMTPEYQVTGSQDLTGQENHPDAFVDLTSEIDADFLATETELELSRDLQRKRNQLEHQISQLENEFGPYFQSLTEPMLELAEVYRGLGDAEGSLELLDRSLHMVRINNGLESIEQMPVLRLYASALSEDGEYEKAEAKQFQYFQIAQRTMDPASDEFIEIMFEMREHHANRFIASTEGASVRDLVGAYSLSLNLENTLENKYSVETINEEDVVVRNMTITPEYRDNLLWLMSLDYLLFKFGFHERDSMFRSYSPALVSRIDAQRSGAYASEAAFYNDPESNYRRGRDRAVALVEMTAKIEGWGSVEHVLSKVLLGDWYIMFGRRMRANATYTEALELAVSPEAREVVERIFASPSELPVAKLTTEAFYGKALEKLGDQSEEFQSPEVQRGFIKYSYNLSVSGRATDIEILETNLRDPDRAMRQELRQLRSSRTRPAFVESSFVNTNGLVKTKYFGRSELIEAAVDSEDSTSMEDSIDSLEKDAENNLIDEGAAVREESEGQTKVSPDVISSSLEPLIIRGGSAPATLETSGSSF
jgi:hypothetical protein